MGTLWDIVEFILRVALLVHFPTNSARSTTKMEVYQLEMDVWEFLEDIAEYCLFWTLSKENPLFRSKRVGKIGIMAGQMEVTKGCFFNSKWPYA